MPRRQAWQAPSTHQACGTTFSTVQASHVYARILGSTYHCYQIVSSRGYARYIDVLSKVLAALLLRGLGLQSCPDSCVRACRLRPELMGPGQPAADAAGVPAKFHGLRAPCAPAKCAWLCAGV